MFPEVKKTGTKMNRRDLLRWGWRVGTVGLAASVGAGVYANQVEASWIEIVEKELILPRLPSEFAGFTIAHLSDLHLGYLTPNSLVEETVRLVNSLQPSTIVITGDFFTHMVQTDVDQAVALLSPLRARLGVYGVLGNHDWWENGPLIQDLFHRTGGTLLTNSLIAWEQNGQRLYMAGVDDVWVGRQDLHRALRPAPVRAPIILLAHEPDFADQVAADGRVMLQLSGHSHGGQVCFPWTKGIPLHLPPWGRRYPSGLYQLNNLTLYTNRGIGMVSMPLRFWCRPEITLFTLRPR